MICSEFKDLLVVALAGRLTPDERQALDKHGEICPACRRAYERLKHSDGLRAGSKDFPLPDWETSWRKIQTGLRAKTPRHQFGPLSLRFAVGLAAIAAVFLIGYFVGRGLWPRESRIFAYGPPEDQMAGLATYAEKVDAVLVQWLSRKWGSSGVSAGASESEAIKDILVQTRILKHLYAQSGNEQRREFIEDLELVLVSLTHLQPDDREFSETLTRIVQDKGLRLRLRELAQTGPSL